MSSEEWGKPQTFHFLTQNNSDEHRSYVGTREARPENVTKTLRERILANNISGCVKLDSR